MQMPHRNLWFIPLALALPLLAGCGKSGQSVAPVTTASTADQAEVAQEIAAHPDMVDDQGLSAPGDQTSASTTTSSSTRSAASASVASAIRPLFFFRTIRNIDRQIVIDFSDNDSTGHPTTAFVTIHHRLTGSFNLVLPDSGSGGGGLGDAQLLRKPLVDHWVRHLLLKRVLVAGMDRPHWKIVGTSGVEVTSKDATTSIQSIQLAGGGLDTTITDPLQIFRLRRVLKVMPTTDVTITVTTGRASDVVLLYAADRRFRFTNNGDGTFTGTWQSPMLAGLHHVGINALSNGTLYDDAAPYDSKAWILPYVVTGTDLGDVAI